MDQRYSAAKFLIQIPLCEGCGTILILCGGKALPCRSPISELLFCHPASLLFRFRRGGDF